MQCLKCDYEWTPIVQKPKECPRCKSRYYDRERTRNPEIADTPLESNPNAPEGDATTQ